MDFQPIYASYYDDFYGKKSFIDVVFDDPDYHLKIMYQLIHQKPIDNKMRSISPVSYPITELEISQMTPVVQPIIPLVTPVLSDKFDESTIVMKVVGNTGIPKRGRPYKNKFTKEELQEKRKASARASARRCRKRKRDLIEEAKEKLKMLKEQNKMLLSELKKIKTETN